MKIKTNEATVNQVNYLIAVMTGALPLMNLRYFGENLIPYEFDLVHDIKYLSTVDSILSGEPHCSGLTAIDLRAFAAELGYYIDIAVPLEYASNWTHGGPVIERNWPRIVRQRIAWGIAGVEYEEDGLLAGWLRCVIHSHFGETAEVPDYLVA